MKKKLIGLIILIIVILSLIIFLNLKNNDNTGFKLDNKYYNTGEFIDINANDLSSLIDKKSSFILFVYNNYCTLPISCDTIFKSVMEQYKIDVLQIPFADFQTSKLYDTVKYAPSIIIINDGKIIDYLHADLDADLKKYQDTSEFSKWLDKYIFLNKN